MPEPAIYAYNLLSFVQVRSVINANVVLLIKKFKGLGVPLELLRGSEYRTLSPQIEI